jgi:hypothetical protein
MERQGEEFCAWISAEALQKIEHALAKKVKKKKTLEKLHVVARV